jgi:hypothetical protein
MPPRRRGQPKLTPVAAAAAAVDERRERRRQINQRRAIDDEVISTSSLPTLPLPRTRIAASRRISPPQDSRIHSPQDSFIRASNLNVEKQISQLSFEIEEMTLDDIK